MMVHDYAVRALALAMLLSLGCSDPESETPKKNPPSPSNDMRAAQDLSPSDMGGDDGADRDMAKIEPDAGSDMMAMGCSSANLDACRYIPEQSKTLGLAPQERELTYMDATNQPRTIRFELRRPMQLEAPAPIVLWSHGGASGRDDPKNVGVEWGEVFNKAGYVSLHIAHAQRSKAQSVALCEALGVKGCDQSCTNDSECTEYEGGACPSPDNQCRYYKEVGWDRPEDVMKIIDWLEAQTSAGEPLEGLLDLSKIAYAGHSAGAGATMMTAGAPRNYADKLHIKLEPRISAFVSHSPQGPREDGFVPASFDGSLCKMMAQDPSLCFSRPHLTVTGVGDDTSETVAEDRRVSFETMPGGQKFLAWITDEAARHTTFDHNLEACERYVRQESLDEQLYATRCKAHLIWLESVVIAFLDGALRASPRARTYLGSDAPKTLSEGVMDWERR